MTVKPKWIVEFEPRASKAFERLDIAIQTKVTKFLRRLIEDYPSPRDAVTGAALGYQYERLWRYRVGDWRIICEIFDTKMVILVLGVVHRRESYRRKSYH